MKNGRLTIHKLYTLDFEQVEITQKTTQRIRFEIVIQLPPDIKDQFVSTLLIKR